VKLLHTNFLVCDFEISTRRFRSSTVVDLMQQLYFITGFVVFTKFPTITPKGYGKSPDLCTKHCPLENVKVCSRILIQISLRSIKTLDPIVEKESEISDLKM